jgi:aspartyl/asparaginyl beta-hydroxylase (cupin superfamily)
MQISTQEAERRVREGVEAFRSGRPAEARDLFRTVTETGRANAQIWMLLAAACRAAADGPGEENALDRLLEIEPQAVRALIMKADCRAREGDVRTAARLYRLALRFAEDQSLPPDLAAEAARAKAAADDLDAGYGLHLEASLAAQGFPAGQRSPRFQHSLDISAGRKEIFPQQPTVYFFPELPHIQYFDTSRFAWTSGVEAATDAIRGELAALLSPGLDDFLPYIRSEANQPRDHPLLDRKDWSALFLAENGTLFEPAIARCPRTWQAVQAAPLPFIQGSSPTVMFSLLRAGTRIPAHTGTHNTRLTCHLPLIVPPGCGFRVGNEVREWQVGKLLVFDDTIEHEAWNDSGEDRVVLIFDIWRPELDETERAEVSALFSIPDPSRPPQSAVDPS